MAADVVEVDMEVAAMAEDVGVADMAVADMAAAEVMHCSH